MGSEPRRSGFAAIIGAANVGKSTLLNRLAGTKLAIVSPKEQTTRSRIVGVVTRPQGQVAFVDTPGLQRSKGGLNRYLFQLALHALEDADLVLLLIEPPTRGSIAIDPVNRFILHRLAASGKKALLVINKIDRVKKAMLLPLIDLYRREFDFAEVLPISAKTGEGVDQLVDLAIASLPESEPLFAEETLTDQQERALAAEYIREQVFRHCQREIPYACAVTIESFDESERAEAAGGGAKRSGLVRIHATIHLERASQKSIVIGRRGHMLKAIGSDARRSIEQLLNARVYLSLSVRVEPKWSDRPEALKKLGYE